MPTSEPLDPIAEAHRQWSARWPEHADHMAAVTSVMRAQQILLSRIESALKPCGLTFAAYEALRLLAFARTGALPMGKMGQRLMVHAASVTNVISRLEARGLVTRGPSPADRRVVLAEITPAGRELAETATAALHDAGFGVPDLTAEQAEAITGALRAVRVSAGEVAP
ncbi:MarR family winged helix-turn-helix transcriptional regulator [Actinomadura flavalba]|uniref:MarR family winged helix-turn-helix transcriptional regulator n=1 Tax=Actinomadura flavalba TaxID=1120938 RepID=UPI00035F99BF|nr:MarR family transcriptional regulator [Actinomadura flavalba]